VRTVGGTSAISTIARTKVGSAIRKSLSRLIPFSASSLWNDLFRVLQRLLDEFHWNSAFRDLHQCMVGELKIHSLLPLHPVDHLLRKPGLAQILFTGDSIVDEVQEFGGHAHAAISAIVEEVLHGNLSGEIA